MPPRPWPLRVRDIIERAVAIRESTSGLTYDQFANDADLRDANIYRVAIIGEAANAIPEAIRSRHPEIPWRRIRDISNVLMHVYFGINLATAWRTIQCDVPEVERQMRQLLAAEGEAP